MIIRLIRVALLCCLVSSAVAQNYLGIAASPFGGTQNLYLNPAFALDSRYGFYLNLGAANAHLDNNYVRYEAPFSLTSLMLRRVPGEYKGANGRVNFKPEYLGEILDGKPKNGTAWADLRGPSLMVRLGDGAAIGLTTRLRAAAQVNNASEQLLSVVRAGLQDERFYNIPNRDNQFSVNTNTYAEMGLTLALALVQDDRQQLSLGLTVKRLQGLTSGFMTNRGLTYRILSDSTESNSFYLQADQINAELGYTTYLQNQGGSVTLRRVFDGSNPGRGWGGDIGFSYSLKSEDDPDIYTFRLGVALTDIGAIRYRDDSKQYVKRYTINELNRRFTAQDFNDVTGSEDIANVIEEKLNLTDANNRGQFTSGLPTALSLNADLRLVSSIYVTGTLLTDLRAKDAIAMHQPTLVSVIPRIETPGFGVAVPLTMMNNSFTAGASMRIGPVFLGTDNLFGLMGSNTNKLRPRGADIYGGLAISSLRRKR